MEHDHESFEHACPVCGLAPRQIQPEHGAGFEPRKCTVCGEIKGGSPFRFCKCMRDAQNLGDTQPHGAK